MTRAPDTALLWSFNDSKWTGDRQKCLSLRSAKRPPPLGDPMRARPGSTVSRGNPHRRKRPSMSLGLLCCHSAWVHSGSAYTIGYPPTTLQPATSFPNQRQAGRAHRVPVARSEVPSGARDRLRWPRSDAHREEHTARSPGSARRRCSPAPRWDHHRSTRAVDHRLASAPRRNKRLSCGSTVRSHGWRGFFHSDRREAHGLAPSSIASTT